MLEGVKLINYRIYRCQEESRFGSLEWFCSRHHHELGKVSSVSWRMARDVHFEHGIYVADFRVVFRLLLSV